MVPPNASGAGQAETLGQGTPAHRHDDDVDLERFLALHLDGGARCPWRVAGDPCAGQHRHAAALERAEHDVDHVLVDPGEDLGQRFDDGHVGAEVAHHRGELAADGAAADDRHPWRHRGEVEHFVAGQDRATALEIGDEPRHRAGGEHHGVAGDRGS